ncbi:MAG: UvrD-helicase domain-containing protein [Candidatus Eisenbacteria bacterium]
MTARTFRWTPAQELAIHLEGHDVLIAAGAGAGKTTVLVERILRKLRDGVIADLEQVLVVTFTEKAARQMKTRLYEALTRDPELRRHLPQLSRARISTIHAFCARLLRENFLLAGVEPGFHVLDEHGRTEALEEALRQTFHRWYVRDDELGAEFGRLVELAGFDEQGESLRVLVRRLHEFARTTTDPESYLDRLADTTPPETPEDIPWVAELETRLLERWSTGRALYEEMVRELDAAGLKTKVQHEILSALSDYPEHPFLEGGGTGAGGRYLEALENRGRLQRKGTGGKGQSPKGEGSVPPQGSPQGTPEGAPRGAQQGTLSFDWGRLPTGGGKLPGVQALHDTAKELINAVVKQLGIDAADLIAEETRRRRSLHVLVSLVREMDSIYEAYKSRGGWLDYSDLEVHAARILSPTVGLDVQFREVLVDEYQDVNALQERILSAVACPSGSFRVGDVKQSIYGFRLADPTIFLSVMRGSTPLRSKNDHAPGGTPVAVFMNENYRSRPGVLRVVNDIFGRLFDARTIGSDYAEQALAAGREEAGREEADGGQPGRAPLHRHPGREGKGVRAQHEAARGVGCVDRPNGTRAPLRGEAASCAGFRSGSVGRRFRCTEQLECFRCTEHFACLERIEYVRFVRRHG